MSDADSVSGSRDCGADAAAYALGALEPAEAEVFRRHTESCAVCRDEVAAFEQMVDALPMAAPQYEVPRGLKRRVMRGVRAASSHPAPATKRPRWVPAWQFPRPALAGALALAIAIVAVGGTELVGGSGSSARVIAAQVVGSPGTAELRLAGGHAELIVAHLPPPPAGRIYEVWLKRSNRPPSPTSALFSVTGSGMGDIGIPGDLRGVTAVMVTQEPAGGSRAPTRAPVIVARLA